MWYYMVLSSLAICYSMVVSDFGTGAILDLVEYSQLDLLRETVFSVPKFHKTHTRLLKCGIAKQQTRTNGQT